MHKVADGVWRGGTRYVNWYAVEGDDGLTLVDAGLPGYRDQLDASLATIGRHRSDVRALLLTHGHIDHVGMADVLADAGAAIYLHPDDAALAQDYRNNRTQRNIARYAHLPGTWAFIAHCMKNDATKPRRMPATRPLADSQVVDVPGRPRVVHVPGHTEGSVALELPDHGVVFVGDLLCTVGMGTGRRASPRLQSRGSNRNSDVALASLDRLDQLSATLVLPGHGTPWSGAVSAAAENARRIGCY